MLNYIAFCYVNSNFFHAYIAVKAQWNVVPIRHASWPRNLFKSLTYNLTYIVHKTENFSWKIFWKYLILLVSSPSGLSSRFLSLLKRFSIVAAEYEYGPENISFRPNKFAAILVFSLLWYEALSNIKYVSSYHPGVSWSSYSFKW